MYGRRRREPVIAGLLVRKDIAHLARVFARRRHTTTGRCNGHDRLVARSSPDRPAQVGEPPSIGRPRAAADAHRVGPGDSSPSGHEKSSGARKSWLPLRATGMKRASRDARLPRRLQHPTTAGPTLSRARCLPRSARTSLAASRSAVGAGCTSSAAEGVAPRWCPMPAPAISAMSGTWRHPGRGRRCCPASPGLPAYAPTTARAPTCSPTSCAAATRSRCRRARATSFSICARC
jgi:hypothetical protein